MQVVLTRSREDVEAYARALGADIDVVAMPVMVAAPLAEAEIAALAAALARPDLDGLWLASARAVGSVVTALQTQGHESLHRGDPHATPAATSVLPHATPVSAAGRARHLPVYTVGPATAAAARAAGLPAESLGDDGRTAARALAARGIAGLRLLAPRAEAGRDDALDELTAAGAAVTAVVAYRMLPRAADDPAVAAGRAALAGRTAAACLLFAPSQVDALAAILADRGGLAVVRAAIAIGPTTAAALLAHGIAPAAVAATPTPAGMAAALAAVYPRP